MLPRRTILIASTATALAGVLAACGLSSIGTGDPFYGSFDGAADHTVDDAPPGDVDGAMDLDGAANDAGEGGAALDGAKEAGDAGTIVVDSGPLCGTSCGDAGGTCSAGNVCTIDCTNSNSGGCKTPTCPPGHACVFKCGNGNCTGGADCTQAQSCDIQCTGGGSCTKPIKCGGTSCTIECSGGGSCTDTITCNAARCDIACSAGGACTKAITCTSSVSCNFTCANAADCPKVNVSAPDAAVKCGINTGANDCNDVSCYADAGQCFIGCSSNDCQGTICCSGKCTGTQNGQNPGACP